MQKEKKLLYQYFVNGFLLLVLGSIQPYNAPICSAWIFSFEIWLYWQYVGKGNWMIVRELRMASSNNEPTTLHYRSAREWSKPNGFSKILAHKQGFFYIMGNTRVKNSSIIHSERNMTSFSSSKIDVWPDTEVILCCKVSCNERITIDTVANCTVTLFPFRWQEELFTENCAPRWGQSPLLGFLTL